MLEFAVFLSVVAMVFSFGAILLATRTIRALEEKYESFAETQIKQMRNEMRSTASDLERQMAVISDQIKHFGTFGDLANKQAQEFKQALASFEARLAEFDVELGAAFPRHRKAKSVKTSKKSVPPHGEAKIATDQIVA
jgi:hypothetical protein